MITLQRSRILLALVASVHGAAALAPWFSDLPAWTCLGTTAAVIFSFCWQLRRLGSQDRCLILRGEECLLNDENLVFTGSAYCAPLLQILYFRRLESGHAAWVGKLAPARAFVVLPDSCPAEDRRRLRCFLRWRCSG